MILEKGKYNSRVLLQLIQYQIEKIYPSKERYNISLLLLEKFLNLTRMQILSGFQIDLDKYTAEKLTESIYRLKSYEPIQYILQQAWFYHGYYFVNQHVLIPRPETEELVALVIKEKYNKSDLKILDIGTGSGCIAISLSLHLKNSQIFALDISANALDVAKKNALFYGANINFMQVDILNDSFESSFFDIIISNPPYLCEHVFVKKNILNFEPSIALFVPRETPLLFYKKICDIVKQKLGTKGDLYLEINEDFSKQVGKIFQSSGFSKVRLIRDMAGKDRIVAVQ